MNFFEFVTDKYASGFIENHWDGLILDRVPLIKKMKLRLVTTARAVYGSVDERHNNEMRIPAFTKKFGNIPYVEVNNGFIMFEDNSIKGCKKKPFGYCSELQFV